MTGVVFGLKGFPPPGFRVAVGLRLFFSAFGGTLPTPPYPPSSGGGKYERALSLIPNEVSESPKTGGRAEPS